MTEFKILNSSENDHTKVIYVLELPTKEVRAYVFSKTESGVWIQVANIPVDQLVWNYAYENNILEEKVL